MFHKDLVCLYHDNNAFNFREELAIPPRGKLIHIYIYIYYANAVTWKTGRVLLLALRSEVIFT